MSNSQLFYVTRSLFKRNRNLVDRINSLNTEYLTPNKPEAAKFNREPYQYSDANETEATSQRVRRNSTNASFDRFFSTSARKTSLKCEQNFNKSRHRFLYSREKEKSFNFTDTDAWKKLHTKEPEIDFSRNTKRPDFIAKQL